MKFSDVLIDLQKLRGIVLKSIRPGANITINEIDELQVILTNARGEQKTRSTDELRRIWEELCNRPAVHVDSLLGGSGSSRNQPETIMANLPYVEYLKIDSKKNLALSTRPTHEPGTIKEVSLERLDEICSQIMQMRMVWGDAATTVVFSVDPGASTKVLEEITGQKAQAVGSGVYRILGPNQTLLVAVAPPGMSEPDLGTYVVVKNIGPASGRKVQIGGKAYLAVLKGGVKLLIPKDE